MIRSPRNLNFRIHFQDHADHVQKIAGILFLHAFPLSRHIDNQVGILVRVAPPSHK